MRRLLFSYILILFVFGGCYVTRSFSSRHNNYFTKATEKNWKHYPTPQQFGAVGDGVHDDRESIQTALNKGGDIYFPKGVYLISNAIFIKEPNTFLHLHPQAVIECHNRTQSIGDYGNAGATVIFSPWYTNMTEDVPLLKNVGIEGGVVCNSSPGDNENAVGFAMCDTFYCRNITVPMCNRKGITAQFRNENGEISNNTIESCGLDGITIENRCKAIRIVNNTINSATRRGIYITGCDSIDVISNYVKSKDDAVYCVRSNVSIQDNVVVSDNNRGVVLINQPEHFQSRVMSVSNNICNTKDAGIYIGNASEKLIIVEKNTLNKNIFATKVMIKQSDNNTNTRIIKVK